MLDPLTALGLAGNIVQFVDFGAKLFSSGVEIYHSVDGALPRNAQLTTIVKDLSSLSEGLGETNKKAKTYKLSKDEIALEDLADQCKVLADSLLETLQDLTVKHGRHKKWNSFRQALKNTWDEKDIHYAQQRLERFRSQLVVRLVAILNDKQSSVLATMNELSYSHQRMEIQSTNLLAELKDEVLKASTMAKTSREEFRDLSAKISNLVDEAGKLATEREILNSLRFKTMRFRQSNIVDAHAKTFNWILEKPPSKAAPRIKFLEWLQSEGGLYWIAGKAGSGKSTLMKYLTNHQRVREALEEWAGPKSLFTGSYFFWSAGNEMMKSQQGLLQSLLYDILRQCPAMIPMVTPSRWLGSPRFGGDFNEAWTRVELFKAFEELANQDAFPAKLCFFVDGLDEYDGDPVEIVDILKGFAASSDIKVCLASRPWTELESVLSGNQDRKLMLQEFTRHDIKLYIHDKLDKDPRFQKVKAKDDRFQELSLEIVNKAQGVFLWVFLVVRSLLRGLTHEDTISDLQRRLKHIPPDLESYFKQMLDTIEDVYRPQTSHILQMCLAAPEPLPILTFAFLGEEDPNYALHARISPMKISDMAEKCETAGKRVKARCRDLLEIVSPTVSQRADDYGSDDTLTRGLINHESAFLSLNLNVDFLHRTVRDFFLTKEMHTMMSTWLDTPFDAHLSLCRAFLAQIKTTPWAQKVESDDPSYLSDLIDGFLYHAREYEERAMKTCAPLIEELDQVVSVRCGKASHMESEELRYPNSKHLNQRSPLGLNDSLYQRGWILTMAVQADLRLYVAQELNQQPLLAKGIYGRPLLYCALILPMRSNYSQEISIDMLSLLLDHKAEPNQQYGSVSVWGLFLRGAYQSSKYATSEDREVWAEAIRLLLEHGADPDASFETGRTSEKPTFSGRIIRYPINTTVSEIINECCPKDYARLNAILERRRKFSIWNLLGWK